MNKILFVVDLQRQFADKEKIEYNKCIEFIKKHNAEYDGILATQFNNAPYNDNFRKHLNWNGCSDSWSNKDLEWLDCIDDKSKVVIYQKAGYGLDQPVRMLGVDGFDLSITRDSQVDIIGCDMDACVMANCFWIWDQGITNMRILTDYIYTTADPKYGIDKQVLINIMKRNFGDCVI